MVMLTNGSLNMKRPNISPEPVRDPLTGCVIYTESFWDRHPNLPIMMILFGIVVPGISLVLWLASALPSCHAPKIGGLS